MTIFARTGQTALAATLMVGTAAHADVSAQQVWDSFKENMALYGESSLSVGSEEMSGDTLTVSDVVLTISDAETTVTSDLGTLTFTETGDGTVSVGMPTTTPLTIRIEPTFGTPATLNASVTQEAMDLIVGGTPEEMTYDISAARYVVSLDSVEGEEADVTLNAAQLAISDIAGTYQITTDEALQTIESALAAGSVTIAVDIAETGGPGLFQFMGTIDGLETTGTVSLPVDMDMEAPEMAFVDGLLVDAGYEFGASNYAFSFAEEGNTAEGTASAESGSMAVFMDASGFSYAGGATAPSVSISGSDLPFPVEVSMAEYSYGISLPLAATDSPEEFGADLLISELSVNDAVWSIIDPRGVLDHGPATISLDISGLVALAYDVLDPMQMQAMMMADVPGELYEVMINDLTVRAAGAEILGSGGFTFDNTDLDTFGGMPRPEGSAAVEITGANQLIDKLVQMGLVPEEQVMGARMMMGMFAQVTGDDQMRSELEINEQGHVIVNGQRIQ
ncbi:DUF2125 domain-containing protein [Histidinibacterium lentulum]|uniref:DUF2125 domain-containing protein n=1 Tax=Histidinibacterium lentulum TaxID=2480588 RepID=A0A3N2R6G6_9RHOB|nr:DUF2125 domain-containing protein [Histidinibacterium lentulum]ROU02971.1 DUF2125 domain-containing protein [Histidinibacterium lentulum]